MSSPNFAFAKFVHLLNKPVVIYWPTADSLLLNRGKDRRSIVGKNVQDTSVHWIISPHRNDASRLMIKSLLDGNNLSIWCEKGPDEGLGWGTTTGSCEGAAEAFSIEKHPFENRPHSYLFKGHLNGKYLQTYDSRPCCNSLNKLQWEEAVVLPLEVVEEEFKLKQMLKK